MQSKTRHGAARFLTALAVVGSLVALMPAASAAVISEGFESYSAGRQPCTPASFSAPCSNAYAAYTTTGATQVSTTLAHGGTKSLQVGGNGNGRFDYIGAPDLCANGGVDLWVAFSTAQPTVSVNTRIFAIDGAHRQIYVGSSGFGWTVGAGAAVNLMYSIDGGTPSGSSFTFTTNFQLNHFYELGINCPAGNAAGSATVFGGDAGSAPVSVSVPGSSAQTPSGLFFQSSNSGQLYIDDVATNNGGTGGTIFCASRGAPNFAYDFKEDVDTTGDTSIGGALGHDTIIFHGGGSYGLALLGKNLDGAETGVGSGSSHAFNTTFKIEAATDGASSDFRVTYGFNTPFARGNGDTTGSFLNAVQARFTESGGQWHITTRKVVAGTITDFGAVADRDDPNDSHTYQFYVDTRGGSTTVQVRDSTGAAFLTNTLPSTFNGLTIASQWFTSDASVFLEAQTGLSVPSSSTRSTCIYDVEGTTTMNNPGNIPCPPNCSTSSSTSTAGGLGGLGGSPGFPGIDIASLASASGMSSGAFGGFAAILFMLIMATTMGSFGALMSKNSNVPIVMGGIGAVGGLGLDMFFGLIPLWLAALLGVAALGLFIFLRGR